MPFVGNAVHAPPDRTPPFGQRPSTIWQEYHSVNNLVIQNQFFNQFVPGADLLGFYGCNNITILDCDFDTMNVTAGAVWDRSKWNVDVWGDPGTAANRKAIYMQGCTGTLTIIRCRIKNPAHNAIQLNTTHMSGVISDCRIRGTTIYTEDVISLFQSGGVDATNRLTIYNVRIDGNVPSTLVPGYTSSSGSGINIGDSAQAGTGFVDIVNCSLLNPGQIGIGVAGGADQKVIGNRIWSDRTGTSNVGLSIWKQSAVVCSSIEARQNRVKWLNSSNVDNPLFNQGNCGTVVGIGDNVFTDPSLDPAKLAVRLR